MRATIALMAKPPELGRAKSRLANSIGPALALEVYLELLQHTLEVVRSWSMGAVVFTAWPTTDGVFDGFQKELQKGEDLGARMRHAVATVNGPTIVLGTDCPGINLACITQAEELLANTDVVFGPAVDGGYYLIATREVQPVLFEGIDWSTEHVLKQSIAKCKAHNLSYALLEPLQDIDTFTDLKASGFMPDVAQQYNV